MMGKKVYISANLTTLATYEWAFLKAIDGNNLINDEIVIKRAIWRYEMFWLPLMSCMQPLNLSLVPPLDIHWVWHCHMLSPKQYIEDCDKLVGMIINHEIYDIASKDYKQKQQISEAMWLKSFGSSEPYYSTYDAFLPDAAESYIQRSSYDLLQATKRQAGFFYNVSLPHFRDKKFLETSFSRYEKFLLLMKNNPSEFFVPCYDIDLIWRTHLMETLAYHSDCTALNGKLINRDDTVNFLGTNFDQNSNIKTSFAKTSVIWEAAYGEKYEIYGTLCRGQCPSYKIFDYTFKISQESESTVKVILRNIALRGANSCDITKLSISLCANSKEVANQTIGMHYDEQASFVVDFTTQSKFIIEALAKAKRSVSYRKRLMYRFEFNISSLIAITDTKINRIKLSDLLKPANLHGSGVSIDITCYLYPLSKADTKLKATTLQPFVNHVNHAQDSETLWGPLPFVYDPKVVNYTYSTASYRLLSNY